MKRPLTALLLSAALLLTACGQDIPEPPPEEIQVDDSAQIYEEPAPSQRLPESFSLPYDPAVTLDPLTCPDGPHQTIGALLYEGLFALDESLQPQKVLCADFSCDETKTVWTFRLRDDAIFSDGSQLTATDAAASLNRARETDRYRARLSKVTAITADENAVTITLASPNASFPALLDIPIVKTTKNNAVPLGTAPYCFADTDDGAMLIASPYRQADLPVDEIQLSPCSGSTALEYQFSSHRIQMMTADLTAQDAYQPEGSVQIHDADTTVLQFIGFNTANPLFASPELRHALGLGIDRQLLVSAHLAGHGTATQSPVSPAALQYPETLDIVYSETAFLDAMTHAGYNSGNAYQVTLLVNGDNPFKVSAARYIANALSVCDIQISVNALPWAEYCSALETGAFDLYYGEARLTADWDLSALVAAGGVLNYGNYANDGMNFLLAQYAAAEDTADALRMLCRYLQAQAPILPLCFKATSVLTESGIVEGLSPTAANPFHSLSGITVHWASND